MSDERERHRSQRTEGDSMPAIDSVFGAVWTRSEVTRKERRWITLTAVAVTGVRTPLDVHVRAALQSRDITPEEMVEFALHFAHYAGWPLSSQLYLTIRREMANLDD